MPDSEIFKEVLLARWFDRFLAWLIDFIIISSISATIFALIFGTANFEWDENTWVSESTSYIPASLLFFAYWIISESRGGQSIGKKILRLKVVNLDGKLPTLFGVIISSFGKSFLLPIDVVLGWIFTNKKRQRIFNKIGDTIVIKIKENENYQEKIKYKKD